MKIRFDRCFLIMFSFNCVNTECVSVSLLSSVLSQCVWLSCSSEVFLLSTLGVSGFISSVDCNCLV